MSEQTESVALTFENALTAISQQMVLPDDAPVFEVINPYTGEAFRILADGRTEGFEKYGATLVMNRIPQMMFEGGAA